MTLRRDRETTAAVHYCGSDVNVFFPEDVYEVSLDDEEFERRAAEAYDALEYVDTPSAELEDDGPRSVTTIFPGDEVDEAEAESAPDYEICGTIKTNGEPCDRPADECRWHEQEQDDEADAVAEDADDGEDEDVAAEDDDVELCGAEMTDGSVCDRAADECYFHDDADADADADASDDEE